MGNSKLARFGIALIGLSMSATSFAVDYTQQVANQLMLIKLAGVAGGWVSTHNDRVSRLRHRGTDSFTLTLRKGLSYKLVSVCDNDCSDLDLTLYDENYNVISRDNDSSSTPIVEVTPKWTGTFHLQVRMYACSNNPCYYGISTFGK